MNRLTKKVTAIVAGIVLGFGVAWAGLETVTHIQDLNASWPLGSDLASTSDDHIRNIKSALKTDFPNFNGTYTSAALPVFAIPSDTNTGMYGPSADDLAFTTGGTKRFEIGSAGAVSISTPTSGTALTINGVSGATAVSLADGTVSGSISTAGPALQFGTGSAHTLSFFTNALTRMSISSAGAATINTPTSGTALTVNGVSGGTAASLTDGTVASLITFAGPSLQFGTTTNHTLSFYTNNATRAQITNGGAFQISDGSASTPGIGFINGTGTGFYRDTANQIGIALGGSTAGQIAQGTYTATITGCTTSPTVTVTYQRIGKMVMMDIPTITCTSNTSQFTLTGAPAVVTPATTTGRHNVSATQDSGTTLQSSEFDMNTSGTLTFYTGGNSSGWTAAGTKGLPVRVQFWFLLI